MSHWPGPDVIIIGAGIVGLAHAVAAVRRGKRVQIIDRDAQANGASVRNFGFVTVTGQEDGEVWALARRSAAVWREVAPQAGIAVEQQGLLVLAHRPEAAAVLEAFMATAMADGCELLTAAAVRTRFPAVQATHLAAGLTSTQDLRVNSRVAIPRLAAWLEQVHGVRITRGVAVQHIEPGRVVTAQGEVSADAVIVCPGDDLTALFPDVLAGAGVTRCKLQMMRLAAPDWRLPCPVMSDLGMVRYLGYASLPAAAALRARLEEERTAALDAGVHLIVVQNGDGSLVVGDSHQYGATPDPFSSTTVDDLILREFADAFGPPPPVVERWTGTYAAGPQHRLVASPLPGVRLVVVTSGTGASTAFGLAEQVIADLI